MIIEQFVQNFLSNLFATLIGVSFGIPIALYLDQVFRLRNKSEKKTESNIRIKKKLQLLKDELTENLKSVDTFHEDVMNYFYPVRDESWYACSNGGELQCLNDPDMLSILASAYASVDHFKFIHEKYVQEYLFPSTASSELRKRILIVVIKQRELAINSISNCLKSIEKKLSNISSGTA